MEYAMVKLSLTDLDLKGKKVLMRVDFNVPFTKEGAIADDTRIQAALPSIRYVLDNGGSVILMSHLGRPKGKKNPAFSLKPCQERLQQLLSRPVQFVDDCIGPTVEKAAQALKPGDLLLLENLRFYPAEEKPAEDPAFAQKLASLGDLYVNDAFGTAHRAHSSTAIITRYFPHKAAAGFLLKKEIDFLGGMLAHPKRPYYAIIGGAKVSSKLGVLKSLADQVDAFFIGGGMAFTFFKALGLSIGKSLCEEEQLQEAKEFMALCQQKKIALHLPVDIVIADQFSETAKRKTVSAQAGIPDDWQGMDIGEQTIQSWQKELVKGKTIFWNGPLGVFEIPPFATGTFAIATLLSTMDATTVVGGGDSLSAINQLHLGEQFSHLSTGGGASLEFLEFGHLPGIDALSDK